MPTHTPHYPDLLFAAAARLRRWEGRLMDLLQRSGYAELRPSLVMREAEGENRVRFFDGDHLVALRWDFTEALARMLVRRFPEPPPRVSYAGAVFRRPASSWEPVERFEVGCERLSVDPGERAEADLELAQLLMAVPGALGLQGGLLHLGSAALLAKPLEAENLPETLAARVAACLSRRAPHRAFEALEGHPAARRLTEHLERLSQPPDGPELLDTLGEGPYADLLAEERSHLARALVRLTPLLPEGLTLQVDPADVSGLGFYTGPTLRLWAPGAQRELAAGGRYDGLFPQLGRPWSAAGFCVRLSALLDLAEARPDLFEGSEP
ncbi:MAG: ATP phosphoribosyltransferase regulatory subunit [Acidobacteria bacterium ADurb.Bin340]|nr:MAG: ATP phosphoribosyltransferase regulatory subunit [Acidobacteria bacterium ADurb.Bin340]HOD33290.1 ATP phosphoribosyltransferase regulatory subunit [Holophaga sp.]